MSFLQPNCRTQDAANSQVDNLRKVVAEEKDNADKAEQDVKKLQQEFDNEVQKLRGWVGLYVCVLPLLIILSILSLP